VDKQPQDAIAYLSPLSYPCLESKYNSQVVKRVIQ